MAKRTAKVFLDTSVIFAAVLSESGGSRKLFRLAEIGIADLVAGPGVLLECQAVVRRKAPRSLPILAVLLGLTGISIGPQPQPQDLALAQSYMDYLPDAKILAEAIAAEPDWLVTHDKKHYMAIKGNEHLPFKIGAPGDWISAFKKNF